ncbi:PREDICTED: uncharacterized protein LOC108767943 [Trachymyrmex cornetzi]|uniref:uncharacterized protein LOC108767943 n=1 Tax=Trachymyrmex cornetzi TaxID=471704 RepID=UPI00084F0FAC|nr:PREDICTED: uncharacterized protein LOC108767943 [Trachymyrmex cornetzi]
MVWCSVPFCNNSSEKGYSMKILPKDPERRAKWIHKINREHWEPTNNCHVCEVHFAPEMWEHRTDKKKLKPNAIPTIFGYYIKEKVIEDLTNEISYFTSEKDVQDEEVIMITEYLDSTSKKADMQNVQEKDVQNVEVINESLDSTSKKADMQNVQEKDNVQNVEVINESLDFTYENDDVQDQIQDVEMTIDENVGPNTLTRNESHTYKKYRATELSLIRLRRKFEIMKYKNRLLQDKINNDKYKVALEKLFTDNQIQVLLAKKSNAKCWSNDTIQRALKLKFTCGTVGYEELLQQGMPFPSLRTLRRKLENFKFESGISNEMLEFLKFKASSFEDIDKECGLVLDEMSITLKTIFDPSTNTVLGNITFPNDKGIATYVLTFMITDTASRWKHVVGYFFTGFKNLTAGRATLCDGLARFSTSSPRSSPTRSKNELSS